ncbi:MAG: NUDIX hydrolase [Clostridia bacterium]|nr:NUDIX hydrolase [Clostridia bacterium]
MNDEKLMEKTVEEKIIFDGRIITVYHNKAMLPDGTTAMREIVAHPGGVCVAALTDDEELLFVRQYRSPYDEIVTELPAGKLERGEDPLEAGVRELSEETGATAESVVSLGKLYPTPGYCGEIIHLYLARGLSFGDQHVDDDEFLDVLRIPLSEAVDMVMRGELPDSKTQTAVLKVARMKDQGAL